MTQVKRWMILGGTGQLGQAIQIELASQRSVLEVFAPQKINLIEFEKTFELISQYKPDTIINCAAWTNVRQAELQEEEAGQVNGWAVQNIGLAAKNCDSKLIHISTDYVFSGDSRDSYSEDDALCPVNAYGRSKALGENLLREIEIQNYIILRTAWLYSKHRTNFLKTVLSKYLSTQKKIEIVDDQFGNPTNANDLARRIIEIESQEIPNGNYHAVNTGSTSWFGLAEESFKLLGLDLERLCPIPTPDSHVLNRPRNTSLESKKWISSGMPPLRSWEEALKSEINAIFEQVKKEL
jgi:dTDP-4-dehydrorhamnose reductase